MDSKRNTKKSQEKAEAILTSAMTEFLSNGYAGTNMDAIATKAGVSKATIYSYFQDKEGLFTALFDELVKEKFSIFNPDFFDSVSDNPKIVLTTVMKQICATMMNDRDLLDFLRLMIGESGRFPELARIHLDHVVKPSINIIAEYLARFPELAIEDTEATARIFMGALANFIILQEILGGKDIIPFECDRVINTLVNLIFPSSKIDPN